MITDTSRSTLSLTIGSVTDIRLVHMTCEKKYLSSRWQAQSVLRRPQLGCWPVAKHMMTCIYAGVNIVPNEIWPDGDSEQGAAANQFRWRRHGRSPLLR